MSKVQTSRKKTLGSMCLICNYAQFLHRVCYSRDFLGNGLEQCCSVLFLSSFHPMTVNVESAGIYQTPYKSVVVWVVPNASQGNSFWGLPHPLECKTAPDAVDYTLGENKGNRASRLHPGRKQREQRQ